MLLLRLLDKLPFELGGDSEVQSFLFLHKHSISRAMLLERMSMVKIRGVTGSDA